VTESFRTQDGRTLTYRREGGGPVLVCHPGGPGYSARYLADLGGLGSSFTLILLNPRGTEGSSPPEDARAYATADYVADLEELRVHLGQEQLDVLGHSHGGVIALAYAAEHPTRARRVVALDTLVRLQPEEMDEIMFGHRNEAWYDDARLALEQENAGEYSNEAELREITRRFWPMYFAHFNKRATSYVDEYLAPNRPNPDALKRFNEGIAEWDLRPELAKIRARILVLTGAQDFVCGPACAEDIATGVAGSTKILLQDCGHFTFIERPDEFRAAVESFLA
jgi:pimeloyl-ACP methyl ester carboxylesterase